MESPLTHLLPVGCQGRQTTCRRRYFRLRIMTRCRLPIDNPRRQKCNTVSLLLNPPCCSRAANLQPAVFQWLSRAAQLYCCDRPKRYAPYLQHNHSCDYCPCVQEKTICRCLSPILVILRYHSSSPVRCWAIPNEFSDVMKFKFKTFHYQLQSHTIENDRPST